MNVLPSGYYLYVDDRGAYPYYMEQEESGGTPFWMYGLKPTDPFSDSQWWEIYELIDWPAKPVEEHEADEEDGEPENDWGA